MADRQTALNIIDGLSEWRNENETTDPLTIIRQPDSSINYRWGRKVHSVVQVGNIAVTTEVIDDLRIGNSHRFDETQTAVHANKDVHGEADKVRKVAEIGEQEFSFNQNSNSCSQISISRFQLAGLLSKTVSGGNDV